MCNDSVYQSDWENAMIKLYKKEKRYLAKRLTTNLAQLQFADSLNALSQKLVNGKSSNEDGVPIKFRGLDDFMMANNWLPPTKLLGYSEKV